MELVEWKWAHGTLNAADHLNEWCLSISENYSAGCWSVFSGQIRRDQNEHQVVSGLIYSAYPPMVLKQIELWHKENNPDGEVQISIVHSLGYVEVGQCSLLVFLASPHRKELLALQSQLIEFLKYEIPVWKQEVYENGEKKWV